jgi:hypothetical protein
VSVITPEVGQADQGTSELITALLITFLTLYQRFAQDHCLALPFFLVVTVIVAFFPVEKSEKAR